jgi:hypothetical protein
MNYADGLVCDVERVGDVFELRASGTGAQNGLTQFVFRLPPRHVIGGAHANPKCNARITEFLRHRSAFLVTHVASAISIRDVASKARISSFCSGASIQVPLEGGGHAVAPGGHAQQHISGG